MRSNCENQPHTINIWFDYRFNNIIILLTAKITNWVIRHIWTRKMEFMILPKVQLSLIELATQDQLEIVYHGIHAITSLIGYYTRTLIILKLWIIF